MKINTFNKKTGLFAGAKSKEKLTFNESDEYLTADPNLDLANGCIIGDIVVDVAGDVVADVAGDVAADIAGDAGADAAADIAADAAADGADVAADVVGDAAADVLADVAAEPGVSSSTKAILKGFGLLLGGAVLSEILALIVQAIEYAASDSGGNPPTSAALWAALYNQMMQTYPCNNSASVPCATNVRAAQESMVGVFAVVLGQQDPQAAVDAQTFETTSWTQQSQQELKNTLTQISETAGIPSMVQYMETYTNPGATGAALVIATANTVISVADYCYSD